MSLVKNKGLKLGFKYLWRHKKKFLRVLFISIFGAILGAIVPLIFRKMVSLAPDLAVNIWILAGLVLLWAILDQTHNWTTRYGDKNGAFVARDTSVSLFIEGMQHLIRMPMTFLVNQRLGKIIQRLEHSANYLERDIREVVFSLLPHFTTAILGISLTMYLEWRLSLVLLVVVIFYILAMVSKTKIILDKTREVRKMWEESWGYLWDVISNIRSIKGNTTEKFESDRIKQSQETPTNKEKEIEEVRTQLKAREHLIFGLGAVITLSGSVYLLRIGQIDAGTLVAFLFYLNLVYKPFSQLAYNWRLIQESTVSLERTANLLNLAEEDYESGERYEITGEIEFKNVSFTYEDKEGEEKIILENISFRVKAGETVALVGESGVGKTTLVDLIPRYFEPLKGSILVDGKNLGGLNLESLRSQIAIVPQDVSLFNDTVRLNIAYGDTEKIDSMENIKEAAMAAFAHEFIMGKRFKDGYDQIVGERGVKISTGQRQRIAIARALLRNPKVKILILDEITSALDSESEKHIQGSLNELKKGKTTFIIAHRLSTIKNADKIIVLDKGGIAEIGRHDELIKRGGSYRRFVELQSLDAIVT